MDRKKFRKRMVPAAVIAVLAAVPAAAAPGMTAYAKRQPCLSRKILPGGRAALLLGSIFAGLRAVLAV